MSLTLLVDTGERLYVGTDGKPYAGGVGYYLSKTELKSYSVEKRFETSCL
jgi:hypothetical protein